MGSMYGCGQLCAPGLTQLTYDQHLVLQTRQRAHGSAAATASADLSDLMVAFVRAAKRAVRPVTTSITAWPVPHGKARREGGSDFTSQRFGPEIGYRFRDCSIVGLTSSSRVELGCRQFKDCTQLARQYCGSP